MTRDFPCSDNFNTISVFMTMVGKIIASKELALRIVRNTGKYGDLVVMFDQFLADIGNLKILWIIMLTYYKDFHSQNRLIPKCSCYSFFAFFL